MKKLLALVLCVMLFVSVVPASAFAANETIDLYPAVQQMQSLDNAYARFATANILVNAYNGFMEMSKILGPNASAEAIEEAEFCIDVLWPYELQLPMVFDAENINHDVARTDKVSGEQFTKNALAFCERILQEGYYQTAIYSNLKWEAFTYDLEALKDYQIWYADYEKRPQTPYNFTWWQYSEKGSVPGIAGKVDLDIELIKK